MKRVLLIHFAVWLLASIIYFLMSGSITKGEWVWLIIAWFGLAFILSLSVISLTMIRRNNRGIERENVKISLWDANRWRLNKSLAISGAIVILFTALVFKLFPGDDVGIIGIVFLIGTIGYLVYIATANVLAFILEAFDRMYGNSNNRISGVIFNLFLWTIVCLPFLYPIFIFTALIINY